MLQSKYPEIRSILLSDVPEHDTCPEKLDILVTDENVETVAKSMSGLADPDGVDSLAMSGTLLKHGRVRCELRKSLAKFFMCLSNGYPLWASYRDLTWGD